MIFRNKNGKFICAVYICESVEDPGEDIVRRMWPRAFGKSVTWNGLTRTPEGHWRWLVLVNNARQTTGDDVRGRLARCVIGWHSVEIAMAVAERGEAERTGTPRAGTRRVNPSTAQGKVLVGR